MLKDEPNDAKAIIENALGFALAAQDNFTEAVTHYQKAIKSKPDYPVALNNLAFAKQKLMEEELKPNDLLMVTKIDRCSRNTLEFLKLQDILFKQNMTLHVLMDS